VVASCSMWCTIKYKSHSDVDQCGDGVMSNSFVQRGKCLIMYLMTVARWPVPLACPVLNLFPFSVYCEPPPISFHSPFRLQVLYQLEFYTAYLEARLLKFITARDTKVSEGY